ncbi:MAG: hypothetical protein UT48_C0045G0003 [Parcubacteria group bacterium GW2011_GWE2_39_37]|uniref:Uncharacterized protein n=1 Tax=Candidatus Falkowbacteria bacterium GW2011_GWF2_39_8 TaxID=1618642 RepID=A0A0G0SZM7_9BACT|nr:MAG: hypothetical protein UT48_C0045G0003 [Parcubacteria group bacterium GW2011_GWE2_39_37]KKR31067.1 MAG: hypothetical protein UT64_C0076G0011 [Candidatus Falkowbacteria bacterium GW2011_GWF2_39_8]
MFKAIISKKQIILKSFLIFWLVIATGYIIFDLYSRYQVSLLRQAYNAGLTDTINNVIRQAEESKCQPFDAYSGEKKVSLIDVKCLQNTAQEEAPKQ